MSDEVEKVKESEPDFMLHQRPPAETDEADDSAEGDDFELHQHKPAGVADKYKEKYKEI
jgi:hypothetical protein